MDSGHSGNRIGSEYADHLTEADLQVIASAADRRMTADELRRDPGTVLALFDRPEVFHAVFNAESREPGRLIRVSPFLVFAVALHRFASELSALARQRARLDDVARLRAFLDSLARRLFLAELLTSFTVAGYRVHIGDAAEVQRGTGLDPASLSRMLDEVPAPERPGIYRRLGDVTLFLAGVFPDRAVRQVFGQVQPEALLAVLGQGPSGQDTGSSPGISMLERLGSRWYRAACELAPVRSTRLAVVAEVADRFSEARRVLNQVARRYLFPADLPWFRPPLR